MRTWWENEDVLQRFREWLSRTSAEVAATQGDGSDGEIRPGPLASLDKPDWLDELDRYDAPDEINDEVAGHDPADEPAPVLPKFLKANKVREVGGGRNGHRGAP